MSVGSALPLGCSEGSQGRCPHAPSEPRVHAGRGAREYSMWRSVRSRLALCLLLALWVLLPGEGWGQQGARSAPASGSLDHQAALERIVRKLLEQFPRVSGLVASIRGDQVYLTLEQNRGVQPGTRLSVFRKMGAFKHPLTGEVLGHFEEDLGAAVVTEVREKYVLARLEPAGNLTPRPGDGVRITAARIRLALLPIVNQTRERFDQDVLLLDFQTLLERTGRFQVFDVDKLQVWFLENRIAAEDALKPEVRDRLRRFAGTDLALATVLRKLGDRQVLDSRLTSLADGKSGEGMTALVSRLPALAAASSAQGRSRAGVRLDEGVSRERDTGSPLNPNFRSRTGVPGRGIQRSQTLDWVATGVAVGDFDGDKQQEVAFVHDYSLTIYRWDKGVLVEVFSYRGSAGDRFFTVDSIDLDGNGRPEIYVTSYRHPNVNAFVLAYVDGKYKVVANLPGSFLRVIEPSRGKPMLVGQAIGVEAPFYGPVYEYAWSKGGPAPKRALLLPKGIDVYGFNYWDVDGDGIDDIVQVSNFGRISIFRPDGQKIHESSQTYGGHFASFRYDQSFTRQEVSSLPDGADAEPKYQAIRGRLLLRDVTGDGKPDLVVPANLQRVELVSSFGMGDAEIAALRWDGSTLVEEWRSRRVGGVIVDYQFADLDGDGQEELVVAVVESKLLSLKSGATRLVVYQLKRP